MRDDRGRNRICLAIATLVLGWSVLAFGTPFDHQVAGRFWPVRTMAVWATGFGALLCLILLPGKGRVPRVPLGLAIAGGFLLVYGWFMVWNARADHSLESFLFTPIKHRPIPWAPGSVARSTSIRCLIELSFVMLAVLAAVRAAGGSGWRGLFALLAIAGATVSVIGLFHKAGSAPSVWWLESSQIHPNVFAPYVYNANAAAFMNLCLPLAMGLSLSHVGDEHGRAKGVFWAIVSVVIIAGVVVAASKGGIIVLVLTLPIFLVWNRRWLGDLVAAFFVERGRKMERVVMLVGLATLLLTLVAIGIAYVIVRWEEFASRFDDPLRSEDISGRGRVIELMARMASWDEGSWHGFGPGTFEHLLPYFTVDLGDEWTGRWQRGHSDPLQTLVEWGWIGAAAWWTIGGGAVVCAFLLLRRKGLLAVDEIPLMRGAILALAMVGLHSCMDFPLSIYSIHLSAMLICGVCWGLYAGRRTKGRRGR